MPNVSLDRRQRARNGIVRAVTEHFGKCLDLYRVSKLRTCAMRLEIPDIACTHLAGTKRATDHILLGEAVWRREIRATPILVDHHAAADDRAYPIAVTQRICETLDDDDGASLPAPEAIRARIKCLAAAVRREHTPLAQRQVSLRAKNQTGPADDREVALPVSQARAGEVGRHQR